MLTPMTVSSKINETPFCPCCGRPNTIRHSPEWLLIHFTGIFGNVLSMLIERRRERRSTSMMELCKAAYPDAREVPVFAHEIVLNTITRDRQKLWSLGWDVAGPKITGNGYFLVPLDPDR